MKNFLSLLSVGFVVVIATSGCLAFPHGEHKDKSPYAHSDFECPRNETVGFHPHPVNCELYYGCDENFVAKLYSCPGQQLFDLRYKGCNWPELTHCQDRTRPEGYPPTETPPDSTPRPYPCPPNLADGTFPDENDCSAYYRCVHGTSYHYKCANPLLYNADAKACQYRQNVDCGSRPIPY